MYDVSVFVCCRPVDAGRKIYSSPDPTYTHNILYRVIYKFNFDYKGTLFLKKSVLVFSK